MLMRLTVGSSNLRLPMLYVSVWRWKKRTIEATTTTATKTVATATTMMTCSLVSPPRPCKSLSWATGALVDCVVAASVGVEVRTEHAWHAYGRSASQSPSSRPRSGWNAAQALRLGASLGSSGIHRLGRNGWSSSHVNRPRTLRDPPTQNGASDSWLPGAILGIEASTWPAAAHASAAAGHDNNCECQVQQQSTEQTAAEKAEDDEPAVVVVGVGVSVPPAVLLDVVGTAVSDDVNVAVLLLLLDADGPAVKVVGRRVATV